MSKYGELFENWEIEHARGFIRNYQAKFKSLSRQDIEDLLQECLIHWFIKRGEHDPQKPAVYKTFMSRVLENKLLDVLRSISRQKRKASYMSVSFEDLFQEDDESSAGIFAVEDHELAGVLNSDIKIVLERAVEKLSRRQRELCRLIKDEGMSLREAGKVLNVSKGTIYDEIIRIREVFREEGLENYLKK